MDHDIEAGALPSVENKSDARYAGLPHFIPSDRICLAVVASYVLAFIDSEALTHAGHYPRCDAVKGFWVSCSGNVFVEDYEAMIVDTIEWQKETQMSHGELYDISNVANNSSTYYKDSSVWAKRLSAGRASRRLDLSSWIMRPQPCFLEFLERHLSHNLQSCLEAYTARPRSNYGGVDINDEHDSSKTFVASANRKAVIDKVSESGKACSSAQSKSLLAKVMSSIERGGNQHASRLATTDSAAEQRADAIESEDLTHTTKDPRAPSEMVARTYGNTNIYGGRVHLGDVNKIYYVQNDDGCQQNCHNNEQNKTSALKGFGAGTVVGASVGALDRVIRSLSQDPTEGIQVPAQEHQKVSSYQRVRSRSSPIRSSVSSKVLRATTRERSQTAEVHRAEDTSMSSVPKSEEKVLGPRRAGHEDVEADRNFRTASTRALSQSFRSPPSIPRQSSPPKGMSRSYISIQSAGNDDSVSGERKVDTYSTSSHKTTYEVPDESLGPLISAVSQGRRDLVTSILERGTDPNSYVPGSTSPIEIALSLNDCWTAGCLAKHGALIPDHLRPRSFKSHYSTRLFQLGSNHENSTDDLDTTTSKDERRSHTMSVLTFAIHQQRADLLKACLNADNNISRAIDAPLHEAVRLNRRKMLDILLEHGADVSQVAYFQVHATSKSARKSSPKVGPSTVPETAMMAAIRYGDWPMIQPMISHDINKNMMVPWDVQFDKREMMTALDYAVYRKRFEIAALMSRSGYGLHQRSYQILRDEGIAIGKSPVVFPDTQDAFPPKYPAGPTKQGILTYRFGRPRIRDFFRRAIEEGMSPGSAGHDYEKVSGY